MRRVQKFMGVSDAKPASAPISSLPPSSHTNIGSGSGGSISQDSQYAAAYASNLQVPVSTPGGYQNQLVAPNGGAGPSSPLRAASNPPSPSSQNRGIVSQPSYGDYFASSRSGGAASPVPFSGPLQTPRPVTPGQPSAAVSPGPSSVQAAPAEGLAIERSDLHKTLKALEGLLVNLDEYRDLTAKMAKVEKKLARGASELAKVKSVQQAPSATLAVASTMFDALNEVSTKHAKLVQREYEALNDSCAKYFKKVAKEERAHEELVDSLDAKIKKANAAHEKNVKKASSSRALESHDKYIATVQGLTNDISRARSSHWRSMGLKSHAASLVAASTFGGLADVDFRTRCETVRKVGPHVGKLNEWLSFTSSEAMPALQPPDLEENELLHAQFLANAEAQIQAYAEAQAEAQAKMQEDVQTALRAQQMGWRPPSAASQRPGEDGAAPVAPAATQPSTTTMANLPKFDGSGQLVEQTTNGDATPTQAQITRQPDDPSANTRAGYAPDAASIRSVPAADPRSAAARTSLDPGAAAVAKAPQQAGPSYEAQTRHPATQDTLNVPHSGSSNSGVRLDRAPTGSTMKSMAVQPESWEHSSLANDDSREELIDEHANEQENECDGSATGESSHDRKDSSTAEGTVVDRLSAPTEGSEATMPSLSRSASAKGSEDGNRAPRTPLEGETIGPRGVAAAAEGQQDRADSKAGDDGGQIRSILESRGALSSPTKARPAERALDRYKEFGQDAAEASPRYPSDLRRTEDPAGFDRDGVQSQDDYARARKTSLWERERERMRQLERENELQTRLREEQTLRAEQPPYGAYATATSSSFSSRPGSSMYSSGRGPMHADGAEPYPRSPNGGAAASPQQPNEPYDPDRYAPAVGRSRLSGVSVSRTLSTDTTASERSFVARMKARYQEEKELERSQRELNVLEREKAARRMAMPSGADAPGPGSRRVSEMASRYVGSDSMGYGSLRQGSQPPSTTSSRTYEPMRRYHDSLPTSSGGVGGPRSLASPPPQPNEFGSYRSNRTSMPPQQGPPSIDDSGPPHSDVCGCQRCSVRHYGGGGQQASTSSSAAGSRPPPSRSASHDPREYNVRRQSMPPVRPGQGGDLHPPQPQYVVGTYSRQSYDDLHHHGSADAGPERKVAFAHAPQTIR